MLAPQNLNQENYLPQDLPEKIFEQEGNFNETVTFSPLELKYYTAEIKEMIENGKIIDIPKAIHNAKYFAELEKRIVNIEAGNWTEHELIEDDEDE